MRFTKNNRIITVLLLAVSMVALLQILSSFSFGRRESITFPEDRRKVILIGDSITEQGFSSSNQGWAAGLADWYHRSADVFNRGYSGYNSYWVTEIVYEIFPSPFLPILAEARRDLMLVVIFLGSNDCVSPSEVQHVPPLQYASNIQRMVEHFRRLNPSIAIVLVTPPPVNQELWPTRRLSEVEKYAAVIRLLAKELNTGCADLWNGINGVTLEDLSGGLHLSSTGNRKVFDTISSSIRAKFPELAPEENAYGLPNLDRQFPRSSAFRGLNSLDQLSLIRSWTYIKSPLGGKLLRSRYL